MATISSALIFIYRVLIIAIGLNAGFFGLQTLRARLPSPVDQAA